MIFQRIRQLAANKDYVGRRIYRTVEGAPLTGPYYLVTGGEIPNQTAASFVDSTLDSALVNPANLQNTDTLTGQYQYYIVR